MTKLDKLEQRVKDLERKLCCKTQFFDTVGDLPTEGNTGVIYVTDDGNIYVWNGVDYVTNGLGDAYYTNSYVERLKALGSDIQYSSYLGTGTAVATMSDTWVLLDSIYINKTSIITGVGWVQSTQGNYTADNYNGIGLYSYDLLNNKLVLIASTTNDGDIWKGTAGSYITKDFTTPVTVNSGIYYAGFLYNSSAVVAIPQLARHNTQTTQSAAIVDSGIVIGKTGGSISSQSILPVEILNSNLVSGSYGIIFTLY